MRIGTVFEQATANGHYRAALPLSALEQRGHRIVWPRIASIRLSSYDVPRCDAMLLHRCFFKPHLALVQQLRERGIAIVWDDDDDHSSMSKIARDAGRRSRREVREDHARSIEIARMADLVTTPSERIAEIYRSRGASVQVVENAVPTTQTGLARRRHRGLVIGYSAGREHFDDLKRLRVARVLETVMRRHPGVRVVSVGVPVKLRLPGYTDHGQVTIDRMMEIEREFDIGIAPLVDSAFNRSRSNIKLKEYAAAGAMWLGSPVGPYCDLGAEQGGLLVADHDWADTLSRLIEDEAARDALTVRARAWAKQQTLERIVGKWDAAFHRALRSARARTRASGQLALV